MASLICFEESLNSSLTCLPHVEIKPISPSPKNTRKRGRDTADDGSYNQIRKRGRCSLTSEIITSSPDHDGYQWRKYGEKQIMNSQFSRCYYRCTYSREFNCKATKQVQQQNNSTTYKVTYFSDHSCTESTVRPDTSESANSQLLLDFSAKTSPLFSSPPDEHRSMSNVTDESLSDHNNGDCESLDNLGSMWFDSYELDFFHSMFANHDSHQSFLLNVSECFMYD